jgi:hypothetical protein
MTILLGLTAAPWQTWPRAERSQTQNAKRKAPISLVMWQNLALALGFDKKPATGW